MIINKYIYYYDVMQFISPNYLEQILRSAALAQREAFSPVNLGKKSCEPGNARYKAEFLHRCSL